MSKSKPKPKSKPKSKSKPKLESKPDAARFVRVEWNATTGSRKSREWRPPWGKKNHDNPGAEYLGRLWALFGPADDADQGFSYKLRDVQSNIIVEAYEGPSGSAFGAAQDDPATRATIDALESLINATKPDDCHAEYGTDEANVRIGIRNGKHFCDVDVDDYSEYGDFSED